MPGPTTPITDREKAAIAALKLGLLPDSRSAYIAAEDKPAKDVNPVGIKTLVSRWINSDKVKQYGDYIERLLSDRDADARERGRREAETGRRAEDSERTPSKPGKLVDYSDPANRKQLYNEVIRDASDDPKTRLDAAKVFEQIQRDDRQAAKDSQIQRFYSPIQCRDCIIKANFAKLRRRMQAQEGQPEEGNTTI